MKKIQVSAKTVDKAVEKGLAELGVSQEDVDIKILSEGGMFKKAKVELICESLEDEEEKTEETKEDKKETKAEEKKEKKELKKEEKQEKKAKKEETKVEEKEESTKTLKEFASSYIKELIKEMKVVADIECVEVADGIVLNASGEKVNQLIGKRGETLNAIQTILVNVCRNKGYKEKVYFDVENYKNRREETLITLAERMAKKAVKINKPVKLERMSAYERKIIHTALQEFEGVRTQSEGEEPNRYLIIFPSKD